jgi:hypothetical protein
MPPYTHVPPRNELPDEWASELRAAVGTRADIRSVYWLTTLYDTDGGEIAQDEIHIELVEPPADRASTDQFRELSRVIPGNGPVWTISPETILSDVRKVGKQVA